MVDSGRLVVVGSGVAGLCTALAAAPRPVLLISRGYGSEGTASALAQGGIAAALDPADSIGAHVADTLVAGAFCNNGSLVHSLAAAAPDMVGWLQEQGVAFDRDGGSLRLGREGGHRSNRIVHAGGDATGAHIMAALSAAVAAAAHVQWRGGVDVDGLLLRGHRVCGVRVAGEHGGEAVEADSVVLATGGIGALFARTTNPIGADGAGLALAMAAGARARDLEFVQFHPTALDVPMPSLPLVTEALRGRGALLQDVHGRRLMVGVHPQQDLAPRDIVAREVWRTGRSGAQVLLDATGLGIDWPREFPTVHATCITHGIDPARVPVPVTVAAHYHMGGLATDAAGKTSLEGLYAVGEVACNGVHGANRLASNSLLEGVVFGRRLGAALAVAGRHAGDRGGYRWVERGAGLPPGQLNALRERLWQAAGPVRQVTTMHEAWKRCGEQSTAGWQARLATALLQAMQLRSYSIGAHEFHDHDHERQLAVPPCGREPLPRPVAP